MHYPTISRVLHEGYTGVDAAKATNLTPRTVMKHVYTVRNALNLPQPRKTKQISHKTEENEIKGENFLEKGSFFRVKKYLFCMMYLHFCIVELLLTARMTQYVIEII